MPQNYDCPSCGNSWTYTGNTCTTFRDGGKQAWNGDKSERIDICQCGTQGEIAPVNYKEKNVGMRIPDQGTGKTYTR